MGSDNVIAFKGRGAFAVRRDQRDYQGDSSNKVHRADGYNGDDQRQKSPPAAWYERKATLLCAILLNVLTVGVQYGKTMERLDNTDRRLDNFRERIDKDTQRTDEIERQQGFIEKGQARADREISERLVRIETTVTNIVKLLDRGRR